VRTDVRVTRARVHGWHSQSALIYNELRDNPKAWLLNAFLNSFFIGGFPAERLRVDLVRRRLRGVRRGSRLGSEEELGMVFAKCGTPIPCVRCFGALSAIARRYS
jgi:hypothetical protein